MLRTAVLVALALVAHPSFQERESIGEAAKFKILYAGKAGDVREKRFIKLLKSHFAHVDSIDASDLNPVKAAEYDVIIADWRRRYGQDRGGFSQAGFSASLSADFSKPIVMIGAVGGEIQRHTKLDWL